MAEEKFNLSFEEWIKGFEDRYDANLLWHMKWIWELKQKEIDILNTENKTYLKYLKIYGYGDN